MKMMRWMAMPLVIGMMLLSIQLVFAQEAEHGKRRGFVGTVSSYDGTTLVIEVKDEATGTSTPITITAVTEDKVKYPGQPAVTQVAGTLEEGARVAVLAQRSESGGWEAIRVLVKPVKPTKPPTVGAVVSVEGRLLTIMRRDGTTKTVQLPSGADAPGVGALVTAFAGPLRDEDGALDGDPPVVTGLVRAEEVRERLNGHLSRTADAPDLPDQARARLVADLATTLDNFTAQHVNVLEAVRGKASAAAQKGLDNALADALRGREQGRLNAAAAREKAGPKDEKCPKGADAQQCPEDQGKQDDKGKSGQGGSPSPTLTPLARGAGQGQQGGQSQWSTPQPPTPTPTSEQGQGQRRGR